MAQATRCVPVGIELHGPVVRREGVLVFHLVLSEVGALPQEATTRRSETTLRYTSSIFVAASTQE